MEERLKLLEDKLAKMEQALAGQTETLAGQSETLAEVRQALGTLVGRSTGGHRGQSLPDYGLPAALVEVGSGQLEGGAIAMEAA